LTILAFACLDTAKVGIQMLMRTRNGRDFYFVPDYKMTVVVVMMMMMIVTVRWGLQLNAESEQYYGPASYML
jgi:hypothetical protein